MSAEIAIRAYETSDLEAIVEFSIRAWQPVFESLREILGDSIFERLYKPNWTAVQAEAVRTSCTSGERDVFVAVAGELPVGFVAVSRSSPSILTTSGAESRGSSWHAQPITCVRKGWTSQLSKPAATAGMAQRGVVTRRSATRRYQW